MTLIFCVLFGGAVEILSFVLSTLRSFVTVIKKLSKYVREKNKILPEGVKKEEITAENPKTKRKQQKKAIK